MINRKKVYKMAVAAENGAPKTELQELQMKSNQVTDEVKCQLVFPSLDDDGFTLADASLSTYTGYRITRTTGVAYESTRT